MVKQTVAPHDFTMIKGCLTVFGVGLLIAIGLGIFAYSKRGAIGSKFSDAFSVPDHAKKEVLFEHYEELIATLDAIAAKADAGPLDAAAATFSLGVKAAAEANQFPAELIYVGYEIDDMNRSVAWQKYDWNGQSTKIINGTGVATLSTDHGSQEALIVKRSQPTHLDYYIFYVEDNGQTLDLEDVAEPAPATP